MNLLADNELLIWIAGGVLLVAAAVVFFMRRTLSALAAILGVVLVAGTLLLVEHLIETPPEAVERTLFDLAQAVEDNNGESALSYIAPGASQIRSDVEVAMPLVRIEKANIIGTPVIHVDMSREPSMATVACKGFIQGTLKRDGMTGGDFAELVITFVHDGDRWLVQDYTSNKDWHRAAAGGRN